MKENWQVTNLELSKRLKELGAPQESLWYWVEYYPQDKPILALLSYKELRDSRDAFSHLNEYSAFTVAEHGKALPVRFATYKRGPDGSPDDWTCIDNKDLVHLFAETEADVKAMMRIYFLEKES